MASGCAAGRCSCGIIDSQRNHLCVENDKDCPVNSIKFFEVDELNMIKNVNFGYNDNDINVVSFASGGALVYGKSGENGNENEDGKQARFIPVDFKISNGQPCLNPYYENAGGKVYVLDHYAGRNACLEFAADAKQLESDNSNAAVSSSTKNYAFDPSYQLIDKTYLESLYQRNGVTAVAYSLPYFPKEVFLRDTFLYYRGYFGLKAACFNKLKSNKNLLKELFEDLNVLNNYFTERKQPVYLFSIYCLILAFL